QHRTGEEVGVVGDAARGCDAGLVGAVAGLPSGYVAEHPSFGGDCQRGQAVQFGVLEPFAGGAPSGAGYQGECGSRVTFGGQCVGSRTLGGCVSGPEPCCIMVPLGTDLVQEPDRLRGVLGDLLADLDPAPVEVAGRAPGDLRVAFVTGDGP